MQCPRMECHNSEINSNIIVGVCFLASRTGEQLIWWKYEEWDSSFYQTLILFTWIILRNFQIMTRHTSICQLPVFLRWTAFSGNFSEFERNRRNLLLFYCQNGMTILLWWWQADDYDLWCIWESTQRKQELVENSFLVCAIQPQSKLHWMSNQIMTYVFNKMKEVCQHLLRGTYHNSPIFDEYQTQSV